MRRIISLFVLLFSLFSFRNAKATIGCTPGSGSWHAISGNIVFGINTFHINGYSGSFLNDTNIVAVIQSTTAGYNSGYADHTAMSPVILQQGGVYSTTATWYTATYKQELQVWIDFNDNGVFEVSEEVSPVAGYNATATPNPATFLITIPAGATTGIHAMRMRGVWEQAGGTATHPAHLDPCLISYLGTDPSYYCGDAVDYSVNIITSAPCGGTPTAGAAVSSPFSCSGHDFTLSLSGSSYGSGYAYQWQSSADSSTWTNIAGGTTMTYSLMQSDTTFYRCLVTCGSGGSAYSSGVKVDTAESAVSGTITGPTTLCIGSPAVTYSITGTSGPGTWSTPSSTWLTGLASIDASGDATGVLEGSAVISYSVSNLCGVATSVYNVYVQPAPSASISTSDQICLGSTSVLSAAPAGGNWTVSNGNVIVVPPDSAITGAHPGFDTITYMVSEVCGIATATLNLTVYDTTAGTVSGSDTVCVGATSLLVPSVFGGVWVTTGIFGHAMIDAWSGMITGLSDGPDTVLYTITNYCGVFHDSIPVFVHPVTSPGTISGIDTICNGSSSVLADTAAGGVWSGSNSHATIGSAGLLSGLTAGSATISYTVTDFCGTAVVTVNAIIQAAISLPVITGPATLCQGSEITLSDPVSGGNWSTSNSHAWVSPVGAVSGVSAGTVIVSYIVTNSCGADTSTHVMTINPLPVPGVIAGDDTVCVGATIVLTDTAAGGVWSCTGSSASVSGGVVTGVSAGFATVRYTVTNGCGSLFAAHSVHVLSSGVCNTGVAKVGTQSLLKIYPNPSDGYFNVEFSGQAEEYCISVTDMMGVTLQTQIVRGRSGQVITFDMHHIPSGNYLVKVATGGEVYWSKLVIIK